MSGDYGHGASIVSHNGGQDYHKGISVVKGYGGKHTNIDLTNHGSGGHGGSFGGSFFAGKEIGHKHGGHGSYGSGVSSYDVGHGLGHYSSGGDSHGYASAALASVGPHEEREFPPLGHSYH